MYIVALAMVLVWNGLRFKIRLQNTYKHLLMKHTTCVCIVTHLNYILSFSFSLSLSLSLSFLPPCRR